MTVDHETPLPLYLGLKAHAVTRSKTLVDTLFHLGLCISYDRVLQIQSDISNGVCQRYEMKKGCVLTKYASRSIYHCSSGQY